MLEIQCHTGTAKEKTDRSIGTASQDSMHVAMYHCWFQYEKNHIYYLHRFSSRTPKKDRQRVYELSQTRTPSETYGLMIQEQGAENTTIRSVYFFLTYFNKFNPIKHAHFKMSPIFHIAPLHINLTHFFCNRSVNQSVYSFFPKILKVGRV